MFSFLFEQLLFVTTVVIGLTAISGTRGAPQRRKTYADEVDPELFIILGAPVDLLEHPDDQMDLIQDVLPDGTTPPQGGNHECPAGICDVKPEYVVEQFDRRQPENYVN